MNQVEAAEITNKIKKMKKQTILIASTVILIVISAIAIFMSFTPEPENDAYASLTFAANAKNEAPVRLVEEEGYTLMKSNCYICHNPNTASHDDIIAPPFKGVKMHYTKQYRNKEEFVDAIGNWVLDPSEGKALMYGAVNQFKVMPKMTLDKKDLEKIASYLYDNDPDEPEWMDEHMKEEKGKGQGQGKGKGNGQGKGMGKGKGMKHN